MMEVIHAIQRCCGERTTEAYRNSLQNFDSFISVSANDLLSVSIASLDVARKFRDGWSLFIDADIRLYTGAYSIMQKSIHSLPPDIYQVRFACDDKLLGVPLYGVHLHRNKLTKAAYKWFCSKAKQGIRSESQNIKYYIESNNLKTLTIPIVVGSHDYEQYLADIAVKYAIRGVRYRQKLDRMLSILNHQPQDTDRMVAIEAIKLSHLLPETIHASRKVIDGSAFIARIGLCEKKPMVGNKGSEDIGRICPLMNAPFP